MSCVAERNATTSAASATTDGAAAGAALSAGRRSASDALRPVVPRVLDVVRGRAVEVLDLVVAKRPDGLRRRPEREHPRRDLRAGRYERSGADHRLAAYLDAVEE